MLVYQFRHFPVFWMKLRYSQKESDPRGTRTRNPLIKSQMLYQLS